MMSRLDTFSRVVCIVLLSMLVACQGPEGAVGPPGPPGVQQGAKGDQGIQGENGERGEKGEKGVQGIRGERGDQGIQGEKGDRGVQGGIGERGQQGIRGEKGERGDRGEIGNRGPIGLPSTFQNSLSVTINDNQLSSQLSSEWNSYLTVASSVPAGGQIEVEVEGVILTTRSLNVDVAEVGIASGTTDGSIETIDRQLSMDIDTGYYATAPFSFSTVYDVTEPGVYNYHLVAKGTVNTSHSIQPAFIKATYFTDLN